ncbi:hypothetical protein HYU21_02380 [Candidatus Woesearchaeota archaeon]|nr:hypothetical protein [Candidatus Woesearchaeota archaeon]
MLENKQVATWIKILSYVLVVIFIFNKYRSILKDISLSLEPTKFQMGEAFGVTFFHIIGGFIMLLCADKCSKWAIMFTIVIN